MNHSLQTLRNMPAFDRNNVITVFLMTALPAIAGSAISVILSVIFVWGVISIARRVFASRLLSREMLLVWSFSAFPFVTLLTAIFRSNPWEGVLEALSLLPFLSVWVLIPRLRAAKDMDYLGVYSQGAAIGAIGALIFAVLQYKVFSHRPEGGAGNAAVFGMISLQLMSIAALNVTSPNAANRMMAVIGTVCGLLAVLLSFTRGVWIVAGMSVIVILLYAPRAWLRLILHPIVLGIAAAVALWLFYNEALIVNRWNNLFDQGGSADQRIQMWIAGFEAFQESPFWGHGVQNRMAALNAHSNVHFDYTHAHNGFLSAAIDGGVLLLVVVIVVLAAPILTAVNAPYDSDHRKRVFLAGIVSMNYALCGITQIMFGHDILDSFFVFTAIVVASSAPIESHEGKDVLESEAQRVPA